MSVPIDWSKVTINHNLDIDWTKASPLSSVISHGNNGASSVSVTYTNLDPASFFNSEDDISMPTSDVIIDNSNIANIRSMITCIYNEFGNVHAKAFNLNCFFYFGKDDTKTCFQYLKSLPVFRLSLSKHAPNSIVFSSDWEGHPRTLEGWEGIQDQNLKNTVTTHKVKSLFVIPEVNKISIYKWGFEVSNESGSIQLIAIMNYALESDFDPLLGKSGWRPPFNEEVMEKEPDFMIPTAEWRRSNEG